MSRASTTTVLLDFDGTITVRDADFVIADAVLPPARANGYVPLAEAYERLEIGAAAYFERFLELVPLCPEEFAREAVRVPLRPGLDRLLAALGQPEFELRVLSEGLDVYIEPALRAAGLGHLPYSCNRAIWDGVGYTVAPAADGVPCARCLNCKGAHVQRARDAGRRVVMVGNGASDLCGARRADLVFARDGLVDHCRREGIAHTPFDRFDEIVRALSLSAPPAT